MYLKVAIYKCVSSSCEALSLKVKVLLFTSPVLKHVIQLTYLIYTVLSDLFYPKNVLPDLPTNRVWYPFSNPAMKLVCSPVLLPVGQHVSPLGGPFSFNLNNLQASKVTLKSLKHSSHIHHPSSHY